MKGKRKLFLIFSLLFILTACGSRSGGYGGASNMASQSAPAPAAEAPAAMPMPELSRMDMAAGETGSGGYSDQGGAALPSIQQNKIIFTGNIYMETKQFDSVLESIQSVMQEKGGYVANSNLYNYKQIQSVDYRTYHVTLKVPAEVYKETFSYLRTLGRVLSYDESAEDVTGEYYDMESRLSTKKIEEERVLDMISQAEKIEDLIALERRLGEIRTDIEVYETKLRNLDRLTSYSTIQMTVSEIDEGEILAISDDLGGRIRKSFASSVNGTVSFFESVIVFLTVISIPLVVVLFLALVVFGIYKSGRRSTRSNIKKE